jgi:catechol 2,3-dioxygenase-like lactoylglutathione lyase family enzyme
MVEMHLEVDIIPVSDVERSKQFYGSLGWRLDEDVAPAKDVRIVQFTPPGSGCSVTFGMGLTPAAPGSAFGTLVVSDIVAGTADIRYSDIRRCRSTRPSRKCREQYWRTHVPQVAAAKASPGAR